MHFHFHFQLSCHINCRMNELTIISIISSSGLSHSDAAADAPGVCPWSSSVIALCARRAVCIADVRLAAVQSTGPRLWL